MLRSAIKAPSHSLEIHLARNGCSGLCDLDSSAGVSPNTGGTVDVRKP
jgi:hypothetical protein